MKAFIYKTSAQDEEQEVEVNTLADLRALSDKYNDCRGLIINFYEGTRGYENETIMLIEVYDTYRE